MFLRRASMIGAMLPLTSIRKTTSATPFVFARVCGSAAGAAGSDCPGDSTAYGSTTLVGGAVDEGETGESPDGVSISGVEVVAVSSVATCAPRNGLQAERCPGTSGLCTSESSHRRKTPRPTQPGGHSHCSPLFVLSPCLPDNSPITSMRRRQLIGTIL